jgi:anhydro-N-acetylmuramic acid kinase
MRAVGLMSGTSLDGIDVADIEVDPKGDGLRAALRLLHFATVPFGAGLRTAIADSLPPNPGTTAGICELNYAIGEAFAEALLRSAKGWGIDLSHVDVIGSHGHTLYHAPNGGATLQAGEAAVIAARTGVTCVADFRAADIAAGGQGAPLVPFVDRRLFGSDSEYRVALNIGGIANVTLLPCGAGLDDVRAFDTGPGNMIIDECVRLATQGASAYDDDGRMAARGTPDGGLLDELIAHPYFAKLPPKSTGRETFGSDYARRFWERGLARGLEADDIVATVTALTAKTIADAVPKECERVIASGGGTHNTVMIAMLRAQLAAQGKTAQFALSDAHGIPVDAKEAIAFAMLACEAICGQTNHLRQCTGARHDAILGKVAPGRNFQRLMNAVWSEHSL